MPVGAGALLKHGSFVFFLLSRSLSRFSSQIGAVAIGWQIYDLTGSYVPAFEVFVVMCLLGAAVTYSCRTFEAEQSRQPSAPIPVTA